MNGHTSNATGTKAKHVADGNDARRQLRDYMKRLRVDVLAPALAERLQALRELSEQSMVAMHDADPVCRAEAAAASRAIGARVLACDARQAAFNAQVAKIDELVLRVRCASPALLGQARIEARLLCADLEKFIAENGPTTDAGREAREAGRQRAAGAVL